MNNQVSESVDAAVRFADNIATVRYGDLPPEVVAVTKRAILDTLGVAVAGTTALGSDMLVDLARDIGGKEESTILCYNVKVPSLDAAMVNSTMARAWDFFAEHYEAHLGGSIATVPSAFAIAEKSGKVDGQSLITAVALAMDMNIRMGLAWNGAYRGWSHLGHTAYFGAAAAAGKLLGLDRERLVNAFGIAYSQATGHHQGKIDGALTPRLNPGLAARGGVFSALLAEKGFTGERNSLEGRWGLYNLFRDGDYDSVRLTEDLGKRFEGISTGFKLYPCCAHNHCAIFATLAMVSQHNILPEQIKAIRVGGSASGSMVVAEPIEVKRTPRTVVDAQFSLPYTIAAAILDRKVTIDSFSEEAIKRPQILKLTEKITPYLDSDIERESGTWRIQATKLELTTVGGDVYSMRVDYAPGHPKNPMSEEDFNRKFWDCMSRGVKLIPKQNVQEVIDLTDSLEKVDDVTQIMRLLG